MSTGVAKQKAATESNAPAAQARRRVASRLWVALLLVALGCALGAWRLFFYRSPVDKGLHALQTAYRAARPLEARFGGFDYAPFASLRGAPTSDDKAHALAAQLLLEAAVENPSAESHYALGQLYLAERKFDEAIHVFEKALEADPQNARAHSDLGAALFEKGRDGASDEDGRNVEAFARSLSHLNRALALDPNLNESLFNRALLRQQMMLTERAAEDWRAYLEKDSNSQWADEARLNLDRLGQHRHQNELSRQSLIEDFLNACRVKDTERALTLLSLNREKLTAELLAAYLKSADQPRQGSKGEPLDALIYIGELDAGRTGDRYIGDLGRFYRSASKQQLFAARRGQELMRQARELYLQGQVEKAVELRTQARDIFTQIGDTCSQREATYWLALHYWELGRTRQSQALLDPLLRACEADGYHRLRAQSLYQRATIAFKFDEYSNSLTYYQQMKGLAERINDDRLAVNAEGGLIDQYRLLNNQVKCFRQIAEIWPLVDDSKLEPITLWRLYYYLTMAFNTFGFYDAAIECARESLRFASESNNFTMLSFSYANVGLTSGKAQNYEEAFGNIRQAYDIAAEHSDKSLGHLMMAYATVQMANLHRERGEFAEALGQYDNAIELHRRHGLDFSTHLYQAYKGRLACYMALNDTAAAQQQLAMLIDLMGKHRAKIVEEENRDHFFDVEQSVYDLGIDLAYTRVGDWQQSFAYAEVSRARSLLDSMSADAQVIERGGNLDLRLQAAAQPLSLAEIQARIPDGARLLEYCVLDDKLLAWVVSRNDLKPVEIKVSQSALSDAVERFLKVLQGVSDAEGAEAAQRARELFSLLIAPVEPLLGDCRALVIVPDKALNRMPWDALISPASDRFLLEDYLVTLAPSATVFAVCTDIAAQKADARDERILSVGDPRFDARAFPQLRTLAAAGEEAEKVAALYSSPRLLVGPQAREASVRSDMAQADVTHFALHCVVNERSALRSCLVLAKEPTAGAGVPAMDGRLQAYEIYGLKLPRMRLAVLSACQTGVERYFRGEGMVGMARAFMVARVPLVVASLWPVDSDATAELMVRFHQYRKRDRLSTSEALWRAKRSLLAGERYRQPRYWAAFQAFGGHANF